MFERSKKVNSHSQKDKTIKGNTTRLKCVFSPSITRRCWVCTRSSSVSRSCSSTVITITRSPVSPRCESTMNCLTYDNRLIITNKWVTLVKCTFSLNMKYKCCLKMHQIIFIKGRYMNSKHFLPSRKKIH